MSSTTSTVSTDTTLFKVKVISSYHVNRVMKNKVSIEKYEKTISILDRKIPRLELLSEILLNSSQKLREKMDDLSYTPSSKIGYEKRKLSAFDRRLFLEIEHDLSRENNRIMIENRKIQNKLREKTDKINRISEKWSFVVEMNEIHKFIHETKSTLNSTSSSISSTALSTAIEVLENTCNIPYIEYKENNSYSTIADLIDIMSNCQGNQAFWDHPVSSFICRCRLYNHSLYNFTIIFEATILLLKLIYPDLVGKVLTLIINKNLYQFQDTIYEELQLELDTLFPNNNLVSPNNKFSDWY
jgi:hypothetical protein